jgi:hypothetical protein
VARGSGIDWAITDRERVVKLKQVLTHSLGRLLGWLVGQSGCASVQLAT